MWKFIIKLKAIWSVLFAKQWFVAIATKEHTYILMNMDLADAVDVNEQLNNAISNELEQMNAVDEAFKIVNNHGA